MRTCFNCKRKIADTESCYRDFNGKIACNDCYKGAITSMPKHEVES